MVNYVDVFDHHPGVSWWLPLYDLIWCFVSFFFHFSYVHRTCDSRQTPTAHSIDGHVGVGSIRTSIDSHCRRDVSLAVSGCGGLEVLNRIMMIILLSHMLQGI
jgi:hypothetical protein